MKRALSDMDRRLTLNLPVLPCPGVGPVRYFGLAPRWPQRRPVPRHCYINGVRTKLIGRDSYPNPNHSPCRLILCGAPGTNGLTFAKTTYCSSSSELARSGVFCSMDDLRERGDSDSQRAASCEEIARHCRLASAWDSRFSESGVSLGDSQTDGDLTSLGDPEEVDAVSHSSFGSSSAFHEMTADSEAEGRGDRSWRGRKARHDSGSRDKFLAEMTAAGSMSSSPSGRSSPMEERKEFYHSTPTQRGSPVSLSVFVGDEEDVHFLDDPALRDTLPRPSPVTPDLSTLTWDSTQRQSLPSSLTPTQPQPPSQRSLSQGEPETAAGSGATLGSMEGMAAYVKRRREAVRRQRLDFFASLGDCPSLQAQHSADLSVQSWLTTGHPQPAVLGGEGDRWPLQSVGSRGEAVTVRNRVYALNQGPDLSTDVTSEGVSVTERGRLASGARHDETASKDVRIPFPPLSKHSPSSSSPAAATASGCSQPLAGHHALNSSPLLPLSQPPIAATAPPTSSTPATAISRQEGEGRQISGRTLSSSCFLYSGPRSPPTPGPDLAHLAAVSSELSSCCNTGHKTPSRTTELLDGEAGLDCMKTVPLPSPNPHIMSSDRLLTSSYAFIKETQAQVNTGGANAQDSVKAARRDSDAAMHETVTARVPDGQRPVTVAEKWDWGDGRERDGADDVTDRPQTVSTVEVDRRLAKDEILYKQGSAPKLSEVTWFQTEPVVTLPSITPSVTASYPHRRHHRTTLEEVVTTTTTTTTTRIRELHNLSTVDTYTQPGQFLSLTKPAGWQEGDVTTYCTVMEIHDMVPQSTTSQRVAGPALLDSLEQRLSLLDQGSGQLGEEGQRSPRLNFTDRALATLPPPHAAGPGVVVSSSGSLTFTLTPPGADALGAKGPASLIHTAAESQGADQPDDVTDLSAGETAFCCARDSGDFHRLLKARHGQEIRQSCIEETGHCPSVLLRQPLQSSSEWEESSDHYPIFSSSSDNSQHGGDSSDHYPIVSCSSDNSEYGGVSSDLASNESGRRDDCHNLPSFHSFLSGLQTASTSDRLDGTPTTPRPPTADSVHQPILEADDEAEEEQCGGWEGRAPSVSKYKSAFHFSVAAPGPPCLQHVTPAPDVLLWTTDRALSGLTASGLHQPPVLGLTAATDSDVADAATLRVCGQPRSAGQASDHFVRDLTDRLSMLQDSPAQHSLPPQSLQHHGYVLDPTVQRQSECRSTDCTGLVSLPPAPYHSASYQSAPRAASADCKPTSSASCTDKGATSASNETQWMKEKTVLFQRLLDDLELLSRSREQQLLDRMVGGTTSGNSGRGNGRREEVCGGEGGLCEELYRTFTRDFLEQRQNHVCPFIEDDLPALRFRRFLLKVHNCHLGSAGRFRLPQGGERLPEEGGEVDPASSVYTDRLPVHRRRPDPLLLSPGGVRDRLVSEVFVTEADDVSLRSLTSGSDSAYSSLSRGSSRYVSDLDSLLQASYDSRADVSSLATDVSLEQEKMTSVSDVFDHFDIRDIDQTLLNRLRVAHYKAQTL